MNSKRKVIKVAVLTPSTAIKGRVVLSYLIDYASYNNDFEFEVWTADEKPSLGLLSKFKVRKVISKSLDDDKDIQALTKTDILLVCGWGSLISAKAIKAPRLSALNCHSSYLPDYKGGSVYLYQWANLEVYGGASIHYLTEKFDSGNILARQKFRVKLYDKPADILYKASELTGPLAIQALFLAIENSPGLAQSGGRYFKKASRKKILIHRIYNLLVGRLTNNKWMTPYVSR